MEEILELKELLLKGDMAGALLLVEDLEEMGISAIIGNIRRYAKFLLLHLIKQQAENRSTKSWEVSIRSCVEEIKFKNQRQKAKGYYLSQQELREILDSVYDRAIDAASLEVAEGRYEPQELSEKVFKRVILNSAMVLLSNE